MLSALVAAGIEGGYLTNPRLALVHWQAGDRPLPPPRVSVAGESGLWVDPAEIPSAGDVEQLGKALAAGWHGDRDQLMANTAAYSGLRWGEIAAVTVPQVDTAPPASSPWTARWSRSPGTCTSRRRRLAARGRTRPGYPPRRDGRQRAAQRR
jgi:integrase